MLENQPLTVFFADTSLHLKSSTIYFTGAGILAGLAVLAHATRSRPTAPNPCGESSAVKFTDQNITERFVAAIPEITPELNLELGTAKQVETFTRSDNRTVLWGLLDLGTNVAQISLPVTYRYHVHLRGAWKLTTQQNKVIVHAPELRASLPPAIHTEEMEKLGVRGWARSAPNDLLEEVQRQITPTLTRFANDPRRLSLVRETCRNSVAEFVQLWLEREKQWSQKGFTQIQVKFADEAALPLTTTRKLLS